MTHCPRCNRRLDTSNMLLLGHVVVACRGHGSCQRYAVEPPEGIDWEWLEGGPGLADRLRASAEAGKAMAMMRLADSDDPRWSEVMG